MTPWHIVGAIALPNVGGIIGAFYTRDAVKPSKPGEKPWYDTLKRPDWRPPNWMFAPVWTTLYSGMGYASYLVAKETNFPTKVGLPLALYGTQLALNWIWTPLFFKMRRIDWGLYDITALTVTAAATGITFYNVNKTAGYLFIPYIAWLGIATTLNYCIWRDNPSSSVKITEIKDEKKN